MKSNVTICIIIQNKYVAAFHGFFHIWQGIRVFFVNLEKLFLYRDYVA